MPELQRTTKLDITEPIVMNHIILNYAEIKRYIQETHISSGLASEKRTTIDKNINFTMNQVPNYAENERYTQGNHISSESASAITKNN